MKILGMVSDLMCGVGITLFFLFVVMPYLVEFFRSILS